MKYERLTRRNEIGDAVPVGASEFYLEGDKESLDATADVFERLADIEDKIENGTLVELPCKVGDTVYAFHYSRQEIREWEVFKVLITDKFFAFILGHRGTDDYVFFYEKEIGENYFLSKSSAEARLAELKGEKR